MYEKIDKTRYTPMMRQYLDIKENYQDMLVLFRLGDFYELFFNDAIIASRELEIVLTSRDAGSNNDKVPMCGVPYHAVDDYIDRLTDKGYKIAIVEQLEDPSLAKNIVKRDVIKVITPGTNTISDYLDSKTNNYLGAIDKISEHKYIFSYIDLSTGETYIKACDNINLIYSDIIKLNIKEIVVKNNFPYQLKEYLHKVLNVVISYEDNQKEISYLQSLSIKLDHSFKPCCNMLLNYCLKTQRSVLLHLKPFNIFVSDDFMKLDFQAIKSLEIIESIKGDKYHNNLFSLLDKCSTCMGSRLLKKNLLYPLMDKEELNHRYDLIEEFNQHFLAVDDLKNDLYKVYDLERIVGRLSLGSVTPKDLLWLKNSISVLPHLKIVLNSTNETNLKDLASGIKDFNELYQELNKALNDTVPVVVKDGGTFRSGYNEELDAVRNINTTNRDFLLNLEKREKEKTGIKTLKVGYNRVFGYYIEITKANLNLIKEEYGYIRKQTTSNSERFITQELKERENLILRSDDRAIEIEIQLFNNLKERLKKEIAPLQILASKIAYLDMMVALSIVAKSYNYKRPILKDTNNIKIIEGRHPVLELYSASEVIPNDLIMDEKSTVLIITGPNMSGKSTFMRQNVLIAILAQIGSFVPAKIAELPLFDAIYTRIGSSDDITSGESTFMNEMLEVNKALTNATIHSLIIFDEVGRGTSTYDGMALDQSIIEYIDQNIKAKTLFSTHYHELTELENHLPNIHNVHVEAKTIGKEMIFLHKVLNGATNKSYGINVAHLAGIDEKITSRAFAILKDMISQVKVDGSNYQFEEEVKIVKNDKITETLLNIDINDLTPLQAFNTLIELIKLAGETDE